jgi:hypothetical protein
MFCTSFGEHRLAVNRTQIYLTALQVKQLRSAAQTTGKTQSMLIREAIDAALTTRHAGNWREIVATARGMWRKREDLIDLRQLRQEPEERLQRIGLIDRSER